MSPFQKHLITFLAGGALASTMTVFSMMPRCDREIQKRDDLIGKIQADRKLAEIETKENLAAALLSVEEWRARAQVCGSHVIELEQSERQREFRDRWYTIVYEPGPPAASPFAALDLVRPGLGSMLGKLQGPQPAGMQPRYVLHGIVDPLTAPPGARFVRTQVAPESVTQ